MKLDWIGQQNDFFLFYIHHVLLLGELARNIQVTQVHYYSSDSEVDSAIGRPPSVRRRLPGGIRLLLVDLGFRADWLFCFFLVCRLFSVSFIRFLSTANCFECSR